MSEIDPSRDPYEAQIAAAREEMRLAMETTGDRLEAMLRASTLTGTPLERDVVREIRGTLALAHTAFNLFNNLDPNAAGTTYNTEIAEQYAHLLPPEEPEAPPVEEVSIKDLERGKGIGGAASKETVQIDDPGDFKDDADLSPEEKRQKYLSMDLPTLFKKLNMEGPRNQTLRTKTIRLLTEELGATTLRDVLLCGKAMITDTPGLASKTLELFRQALDISEIGLTLKLRPTQEDILEICPTLADLPAKFYFKQFHLQLGERSVAEILAMTKTELTGLLVHKGVSNPIAAQKMLDSLNQIALDFSRAAADKAIKEM